MFAHIGNRTLTSCADKHMAASRRMLWRCLSLLNTSLVAGVAVVLNRCVLSGGGLAQIQSTKMLVGEVNVYFCRLTKQNRGVHELSIKDGLLAWVLPPKPSKIEGLRPTKLGPLGLL